MFPSYATKSFHFKASRKILVSRTGFIKRSEEIAIIYQNNETRSMEGNMNLRDLAIYKKQKFQLNI